VSQSAINQRAYQSVQFSSLSKEQCQRIHWASLEILERTGVRLYYQEAIDLVRKGGADVSDGNLVRIPSGMVEKAFTTVPKRVVLCDRYGNRVMPIEGYRCYYGPGSDTLNLIDHRTGERRKPVLDDIREGMVLCDALPNIDFVMSMVIPSDVDQTLADRHQMETMLASTTKPILFVTYDANGCRDAVEMAEVVVGGVDALRRNPIIACYINVTTGLRHNSEALEKLLYLSERGLPAMYIPQETGGATAPVTSSGELAMVLAGTLTGLVLSQLKREGAPFIMPGWDCSYIDMRTLVRHYADPGKSPMTQAMAHYYNLPMFSLGGCSDSKVVDQQAAAEAALTLMAATLGGGNIIHDLGYLESGLTYSLAQLVICDEIVSWVKAFVTCDEVSDETLDLDEIHRVGPSGQFMDSPHTLKHYKQRFYPNLLDRTNFDVWVENGSSTLAQRAAEKVNRILVEHQVEPLPIDTTQRLKEIVEHARS
jgi:trimethylamine--corrinoid protein Co-methyltransferase